MNSHPLQNQFAQPLLAEDLYSLPCTFADAIAHIKTITLQEFDREITDKQLYYHTREHIQGVQRRAKQIFQAVRPYFESTVDNNRLELLLDLCSVTHDMIQIFVPQPQPHTSRKREAGVSEIATIELLFTSIQSLNHLLEAQTVGHPAQFTNADLEVIRAAIEATVCLYDPSDQAIFQPSLYDFSKPLPLVAQIVALSDIGALGMEGVGAYNEEGRLLLLEENPDIPQILQIHSIKTLAANYSELYENIRQRLLKRARFQVSFAKSRLLRFPREIANLPEKAIAVLTHKVFQFLNQETIDEIERITPTSERTSVADLIMFFKLADIQDKGRDKQVSSKPTLCVSKEIKSDML